MKKLMLVCVLAAGLLFPAAGEAAIGLYAGPKVGFSSTKLTNNSLDLDWKYYSGYNDASADMGDESSSGFGGGFFVGYNFNTRFNIPFRVEFDTTFRIMDVDEWVNTDLWVSNFAYLPVNLHYETTGSYSAMFNLWFDIPVGKFPVRPYVGGGIGAGGVTYDLDANVGNGYIYDSESGSDAAFAWMVGAGISYDLNNLLTLDIGYRYTKANDIEVEVIDAYDASLKANISSKTHDIMLAVRFNF